MSEFHFSPRPNRAGEIHWQPWGEAAFASAKEQGKPVLLAISAVWCHWCHVMDETSYSDGGVIELINDRFVPVRVDNDQRPDVNARYNMGGWPTTALLTPEGELLHGGTYIPPDSMRQLLRQIDGFYSRPDNRLAIAKRVHEVKTTRGARALTPTGGELDPRTAHTIFESLLSDYDEEFGGFGNDQKFPHVPVLHFLLDYWARTRHERAQTMVQKTLHAMAGGGMYDHVYGGFFRYSTARDFSVPHFEKMLEDLGGLLYACARAAAMFADEGLAEIAVDVKRYLDEHLWNERFGGYGGSQDADEAFYALDETERAKLSEPYVDPTLYTAWNAQAAAALLFSAPLLEVSGVEIAQWNTRALNILDTLWSKLYAEGLMCRYYDGQAHIRGLLVDQAWCLTAALAAFSATGEQRWLQRASELLVHSQQLYDAESEGYLDRIQAEDEPGKVAERSVPFEENAVMARALLTYGAFTGDERSSAQAAAMLRRYSEHYESYRMFAASYGSAVLDVLEPPVDVQVVGPTRSSGAKELRLAGLRTAAPPVRVDPIDSSAEKDRLTRLGLEATEDVAYLCRRMTCFARVKSADELRKALSELPVR